MQRAPGVLPGQEPAFGVLLRLVLSVLPLPAGAPSAFGCCRVGGSVPMGQPGWGDRGTSSSAGSGRR